MIHGGFDLPVNPNDEQIETAQLFLELHRPDYKGRCPSLTCAIGAFAPEWPCARWRWAEEVLNRAGLPSGFEGPLPHPG